MRGEPLVAFLHDKSVRSIAFKTKYFEVRNTDLASDFDVFSALCDSVLLFVGHPIRARLLSVLQDLLSYSIDPTNLCFAEYRRDIWQRIFYEDTEDACVSGFCEKAFDIDLTNQLIYDNSIDITDLVDTSCDGAFSALESALLKIRIQDVKMLTLDLRSINYERPDDYHAEKAYLEIMRGNRGDVFLLWLLCRILMKKELKLRLIVNSVDEVNQILSLLSSVKLAPKIYICIDILEQNEYQCFADLILNNYKKNISLEPLFSKEIDSNIILEGLKKLFCFVPLACVSISSEYADRLCELLGTDFASDLTLIEREALISSLRRVK